MKSLFPPRKIVAALDGSAPSWAALSAARALAALLSCELEAIYVEPIAPLPEFEPTISIAESLEKATLKSIREKLGATRLRVLKGIPAAELVKAALPRSAQLLVLGTHGRQGADRVLFGSVAEAVLHRARVPVLAVRQAQAFDPPRVLVPCNLERYGDEALKYALALAARLEAQVAALYVAKEDSWVEEADARLRAHLQETLGAGIAARVRRVVRAGEPREQIALEARTGDYGLVALSAHHRAQLSDLALGTTAERLLRKVSIPLLTFPDGLRTPAAAEVGAGTARRRP